MSPLQWYHTWVMGTMMAFICLPWTPPFLAYAFNRFPERRSSPAKNVDSKWIVVILLNSALTYRKKKKVDKTQFGTVTFKLLGNHCLGYVNVQYMYLFLHELPPSEGQLKPGTYSLRTASVGTDWCSFVTKITSPVFSASTWPPLLIQPADRIFYPAPATMVMYDWSKVCEHVCMCWKRSDASFYFSHSVENNINSLL